MCEAVIVWRTSLASQVSPRGAETAVQRDLLINAGCDDVPGYFFARPLSPEDFEAFVHAGAPGSRG